MIAELRELSPPAAIENEVESLVSALEAELRAPRSRHAPHRQVTLKLSSPRWTMLPHRRRSSRRRQMSSAAERAAPSRRHPRGWEELTKVLGGASFKREPVRVPR